MAGNLNYNLTLNASQAQKALSDFQNQIKGTSDTFAKLKSAIAGIAIGGFITQAFNAANAISDMAKAANVSTAALLGFQKAIAGNGGNAEAAVQSMAKFNRTIAEAADGSKAAQDAFAKVGVGLNELRTMSEEDILMTTVKGFEGITDASERAAVGFAIFGKGLAGTDFKGAASDIEKLIEAQRKNAAAVDTAGQVSQDLAMVYKDLQIQVLVALKPIAELAKAMLANKDAISSVISVVTQLGVALGALLVVQKVLTPLANLALLAASSNTSLLKLAGGALGVGKAFESAKSGVYLLGAAWAGMTTGAGNLAGWMTKLQGIFAALLGGFVRLIPIIGQIVAAFIILNEAVELITGSSIVDWTKKAANSLFGLNLQTQETAKKLKEQQKVTREVKDATDEMSQSMAATLAAYKAQNAEANKKFDLDTKNLKLGEAQKQNSEMKLEAEGKYLSEMTKLQDEYNKKLANTSSATDQAAAGKIKEAMDKLTVAYQGQIAEIDRLTAAREKAVRANNLELFSTNALLDNQKKLKDIFAEIGNTGAPKLTQEINNLTKASNDAAEAAIREEEARRKQKLDPSEVKAYYEAARQGVDQLVEAQKKLNEAQAAENLRQFGIKQQIELNRELRNIQDEMATSTMSTIEKKYYDIDKAARESAISAIEAEEARRGTKLDPQEAEAYYEAARRGSEELKKAAEASYNSSRDFSTGWKKAFKDYAEQATNGAKQAENIFKKATQGMEDMIVNFAKTGKFEWKGFVNMMLEELLRSQIQQIFAGVMGSMSNSMKSVTGGTNGGGSLMGALFGGGGGNQQGSSGQQGGGGLFSGIGKVVGGIGDAIGGLFGGGDKGGDSGGGSFLGDIASGIGDFFGGWFANGGTLGAGKWGIAGENGPELISGPATVTPMSAMGGSTAVTYNINAVDAMSFKQMLAQDPSFIYALSLQGAGTVPARR